jgi:hypothetical protein
VGNNSFWMLGKEGIRRCFAGCWMQDHFRGCQSSRLPATFTGAPNFREVPGVRIFGGAIPTVAGMQDVLAHVGAAPESTPVNGRQVGLRVGCGKLRVV